MSKVTTSKDTKVTAVADRKIATYNMWTKGPDEAAMSIAKAFEEGWYIVAMTTIDHTLYVYYERPPGQPLATPAS